MKKYAFALAVVMALASGIADARGGGSSGGHGGGGGHASSAGSRGGFSSGGGGSRPAVAPTPRPATPSAAPAPNRPATAAPAPRTTTTTTTTTNTTRTYNSNFVSPGPSFGAWGMGYGYSNGLLTGMIIGNMMHPHHTVMYTGPGAYSNNALLYPDGRVVNQQGYHVGNYVNGSFTPVNGGMVAQAVPADAGVQQVAQPVVIQKAGLSAGEVVGIVLLVLACVFLLVVLIGIL